MKEIPLIEEMRQLRRLEELELINPQCKWGVWYKDVTPPEAADARRIYKELLRECAAFEERYDI